MQHFRIIKIADVRKYRDGEVSEFNVHYVIKKKYWLGWLTPIWFRIYSNGYDGLYDVQSYLKRYLKERGCKEKTVETVVEEITV